MDPQVAGVSRMAHSLPVASNGGFHVRTRGRWVQQCVKYRLPILPGQFPYFMLPDGLHRGVVGAQNHELRNRSAFQAGCVFDSALLFRIETGFDSICFSGLFPELSERECHMGLSLPLYGNMPYIAIFGHEGNSLASRSPKLRFGVTCI